MADMFDTLRNMDGVTSIFIPKTTRKILGSLAKFGKNKDVKIAGVFTMAPEVFESFDELKLFTAYNAVISNKMETIFQSFIKDSDFFEFMIVNEDNSRVTMYIKTGEKENDFASDLLMFITTKVKEKTGGDLETTTVISIQATIDINKIPELMDQ